MAYERMKRISVFLLALWIALCGAMSGLASVLNRPDNRYVLDEAGVLSAELESEMIRRNERLFSQTGAEIVVVTVGTVPGGNLQSYAKSLFEEWGIGSKERNNGFLLLMAVGEGSYYSLPGYGVSAQFPEATQKNLLESYIENAFQSGAFDQNVSAYFNAVYEMQESYYSDFSDGCTGFTTGGSARRESRLPGFSLGKLIRNILVLMVVAELIALITGMNGRGPLRGPWRFLTVAGGGSRRKAPPGRPGP